MKSIAKTLSIGVCAVLAIGVSAAIAGSGLNGPNPTKAQLPPPLPVGTNAGFSVLWAVMNSDGTMLRSSGGNAATSSRLAIGVYDVRFARPLAACAWSGTVGLGTFSGSTGPVMISVTGRAGTTNGVFVQTFNGAGTATDEPFTINILC